MFFLKFTISNLQVDIRRPFCTTISFVWGERFLLIWLLYRRGKRSKSMTSAVQRPNGLQAVDRFSIARCCGLSMYKRKAAPNNKLGWDCSPEGEENGLQRTRKLLRAWKDMSSKANGTLHLSKECFFFASYTLCSFTQVHNCMGFTIKVSLEIWSFCGSPFLLSRRTPKGL